MHRVSACSPSAGRSQEEFFLLHQPRWHWPFCAAWGQKLIGQLFQKLRIKLLITYSVYRIEADHYTSNMTAGAFVICRTTAGWPSPIGISDYTLVSANPV